MKRVLVAMALTLSVIGASAVPAKNGIWKTIRLTDGTEVEVRLVGDEFCHYWEASNGKAYMQDDNSDDFVEVDANKLLAHGEGLRAGANAVRRQRMGKSAARSIYTGSRRGLIILANFADTHFTNDNALYRRIANEKNFSHVMGFTGSVRDYFLSQSEGLFDLQFDVVGPVELPNRARYYGKNNSMGGDTHVGQMIADACELADTFKLDDGKEVNFADYDWDGDGEVDQVFVLYAGQGEAAGGAAETIWPQEGVLSGTYSDHGPITLDGVKIDTYACSCELGVNKTIDGIGTICHEFSHCVGLADMYDRTTTGQPSYGMCIWSLMDYGNYMNNSFTPAGYTAFERMSCGWKQPIVLKNDTTVTGMKALSEGGETYIIYNDANPNEYYMLENRQLTGWDAGLFGAGLLITHVDYDESVWNSNMVNSTSRQRCTVIPADNSLVKGDVYANRADIANDPYPHVGNNSLTNETVPAATLNTANTDGNKLMNKSITNVTQNADGTISFKFANGVVSGIVDVKSDDPKATDAVIYSLDGRYMGTDATKVSKGVYVVGGRKVVVP